jgi:hypothetical protein
MLNYWCLNITLAQDPTPILERYCEELIEQIGLPEEKQNHFLLKAREASSYRGWETINKPEKEKIEQEYSDFIDAIYSNDLETFVQYFFGRFDIYKNRTKDKSKSWLFEMDNSDYMLDNEYGHPAEDEIMKFFGEFCVPRRTFIEKQVLEDDHIPYRYVLQENNKAWEWTEPTLVWDNDDPDE